MVWRLIWSQNDSVNADEIEGDAELIYEDSNEQLLDGVKIAGYFQSGESTEYYFVKDDESFDAIGQGVAVLQNSFCDVRLKTEDEDVRVYC